MRRIDERRGVVERGRCHEQKRIIGAHRSQPRPRNKRGGRSERNVYVDAGAVGLTELGQRPCRLRDIERPGHIDRGGVDAENADVEGNEGEEEGGGHFDNFKARVLGGGIDEGGAGEVLVAWSKREKKEKKTFSRFSRHGLTQAAAARDGCGGKEPHGRDPQPSNAAGRREGIEIEIQRATF